MDERDAEVQEPVAQLEEPVAQLAAKLRYLRLLAGKPSVTRLKKLTERQGVGRGIPRATIQDKLSGATAPTLEHVLALVTACAEHAAGIGQPLPREAIDDNRWRAAWLEMQRARADPRCRQARAHRDRLEFVNGPFEVMPTSITKTTDVPPAQRRRSLAEYEQELRRYANAICECQGTRGPEQWRT
jgi:hypothetical protein